MSHGPGFARPRAGSGIFPNEASITRLVGAILMEQNDEWQLQHRYLILETITGLADDPGGALPNALTKAA